MRNAWGLAFGVKSDDLLFMAMGRINRKIALLSRQISEINEISKPTKQFMEETVSGLRAAAAVSALNNSFDHFESHFSEDKLGRLLFANDTLYRIYPCGVPDDVAISEFSEGVRLLLDDIDSLGLDLSTGDAIRELLRDILGALPLAAYFGTDLISEAAGSLAMASLQVAASEDGAGMQPSGSDASKRFHVRVKGLVKKAAEFSTTNLERADKLLTAAERIERVYRSVTGGAA